MARKLAPIYERPLIAFAPGEAFVFNEQYYLMISTIPARKLVVVQNVATCEEAILAAEIWGTPVTPEQLQQFEVIASPGLRESVVDEITEAVKRRKDEKIGTA